MLGTWVNCAAILIGCLLGVTVGRKLPQRYQHMCMKTLFIFTLFLGMKMAFGSNEPMIMLASLLVGGLVGELLNIEKHLESVGRMLEKRIAGNREGIAKGFVTASLLYCVGSVAILGSLQAGIEGDKTLLYIKSIMDGSASIPLAATLGPGVALSAGSVLLYQGALTMFASSIQPFLTEAVMSEMTATGGMLIFVLGMNMLEITKIPVGNLLPAIVVAAFAAGWFL